MVKDGNQIGKCIEFVECARWFSSLLQLNLSALATLFTPTPPYKIYSSSLAVLAVDLGNKISLDREGF